MKHVLFILCFSLTILYPLNAQSNDSIIVLNPIRINTSKPVICFSPKVGLISPHYRNKSSFALYAKPTVSLRQYFGDQVELNGKAFVTWRYSNYDNFPKTGASLSVIVYPWIERSEKKIKWSSIASKVPQEIHTKWGIEMGLGTDPVMHRVWIIPNAGTIWSYPYIVKLNKAAVGLRYTDERRSEVSTNNGFSGTIFKRKSWWVHVNYTYNFSSSPLFGPGIREGAQVIEYRNDFYVYQAHDILKSRSVGLELGLERHTYQRTSEHKKVTKRNSHSWCLGVLPFIIDPKLPVVTLEWSKDFTWLKPIQSKKYWY